MKIYVISVGLCINPLLQIHGPQQQAVRLRNELHVQVNKLIKTPLTENVNEPKSTKPQHRAAPLPLVAGLQRGAAFRV